MALTEQQRAVRLRLYNDFSYYAPKALRVRTKDAQIVPFEFNTAQSLLDQAVERQYAAEGRVRIIILKARQMGLSTYVGGRLYSRVSQRKARKAVVVTHHGKSTKALFEMTKRFHELCPELLRPQTKYSSAAELKFSVLDSGYAVFTAGADSVGRGETFTHAHLSELAFWPKSSALANFNGLMQAIPNADDTEVYIESTANGVSGLFYDTWQKAVSGENGFIPVFLPWFIQAEYREPVPPTFQRTPVEDELVEQLGLDDEQLMFRRKQIAKTSLELFRQEYPATAEEAFLTSGRPVFNPDRIVEQARDARAEFGHAGTDDKAVYWEPMRRYALEGSEWQEHARGELHVYRDWDAHETYYIGADVGGGVQQDFSVAQVLDSRRRQVAMWRGQIDPDFFGTVLYHLGKLYNEAKVICERNNHGVLTNRVLVVDHGYMNFYTETSYDKLRDIETEHVGFFTSEKSKPLIIDKLRAEVRERTVEIVDPTTLAEMRSYIVTETGKMEAEKGTHDDTVMALALANHINEGGFTPLVVTDEYYGKIE